MINIIRQAKNDDYEASDNFLQSGHLLGSNVVQREFYIMALRDNFTGRVSKRRSDDKH